MVAKGLKDYANEKGLKVSNGIAYGVIGGYMVTLKEGYGIKDEDGEDYIPETNEDDFTFDDEFGYEDDGDDFGYTDDMDE